MDEMREQDTYPIVLRCGNCGGDFGGKIYRVPKGKPRWKFADEQRCPRCGCKAARSVTITGVE